MPAISIHQITKTYPKTGQTALSGISIDVTNGEIFGLIGPDGSGKTSLLRILATVILPDSGEASLHDLNVVDDFRAIRKMIGYMPGRFSLYLDLTVAENLNFFATLYGVTLEKNYHMIRDIYIQLEPFKNRRASKLSGGMKQKLALCCALIHHPRILLLDEPTTGVDPVSRKEFWDILHGLRDKGMTILVSTPYMDEAERCDRIALIQEGMILSINTPEGIPKEFPRPLYAVWAPEIRRILPILRDHQAIESCYSFGENLHITFVDDDYQTDQLVRELTARHISDVKISRIKPQIEDCFIQLMRDHD